VRDCLGGLGGFGGAPGSLKGTAHGNNSAAAVYDERARSAEVDPFPEARIAHDRTGLLLLLALLLLLLLRILHVRTYNEDCHGAAVVKYTICGVAGPMTEGVQHGGRGHSSRPVSPLALTHTHMSGIIDVVDKKRKKESRRRRSGDDGWRGCRRLVRP
jgi:hypothetical protein